MPDERVPDQIHVVAQAKVHKSVGRAEIIAVRALPRMDERPLHLVLRDDLVELLLDQGNVFGDLLRAATESPVPVVMARLMAVPT